jgi:hypothetical protein
VKEKIFELAVEFSKEPHGSSTYGEDHLFIMGDSKTKYIPFSYLVKAIPEIKTEKDLQKIGFHLSSADFLESDDFQEWYRIQFNKKLTAKHGKDILLMAIPDVEKVLTHIQKINESYDVLRSLYVINNGKNFPVQLGEWFAKSIFGLKQLKSTSQRGFDFYLADGARVEIMVHWNDRSSPKGVKLKKSLIELSDFSIIIYMNKNFLIRDIIFLDSEFTLRKYGVKGHTLFLKDKDVSHYFFSVADKHYDKIVCQESLQKFCTPQLAQKIAERSQK